MSLPLPERAALSREDRLALACFLCWIASAQLARLVGLWPALGGTAVILGILVVARRGASARDRASTTKGLIAGLAAGGVMTAATYLLYPLIRLTVPAVVTQAAALYGTLGEAAGWRAILFLQLVVAGEELVWRGAVQGALTRHFGAFAGAALGAAAYALAVTPVGSPLLIVVAAACGLYWGLLRAWSGSLAAPLVAHLFWDLWVFLLAPLSGR